jgi:hypothetical protein
MTTQITQDVKSMSDAAGYLQALDKPKQVIAMAFLQGLRASQEVDRDTDDRTARPA